MVRQRAPESAQSRNAAKKYNHKSQRARAVIEKQLSAAERSKTGAIMRKRALKVEIDKQNQRPEKTELAQIPNFTIRNPWKSSMIAFRARRDVEVSSRHLKKAENCNGISEVSTT